MKKLSLIVSIIAVIGVIIAVVISSQSGPTQVHRTSAADSAFATLKTQ